MRIMKETQAVFISDHPDLGPVFEVRCPYCRDIVQIAPLGPNGPEGTTPCNCGKWRLDLRPLFEKDPKKDKGYKGRMRG